MRSSAILRLMFLQWSAKLALDCIRKYSNSSGGSKGKSMGEWNLRQSEDSWGSLSRTEVKPQHVFKIPRAEWMLLWKRPCWAVSSKTLRKISNTCLVTIQMILDLILNFWVTELGALKWLLLKSTVCSFPHECLKFTTLKNPFNGNIIMFVHLQPVTSH